jgi:Mrp family chromosome partitioning ATPase
MRVSIVENAVKKAAERKQAQQPAQPETQADVRADAVEERPAGREVVGVQKLQQRGLMTTVLEHAELSKAFRFLKRAVLAKVFGGRSDDARGKTIMVTSALPGAGKSFMAFNLAASVAKEQLVNVVLIDADVVRHNLTTALDLAGHDGLLDILVRRKFDEGMLPTDLAGLQFIPSGNKRDDGSELLAGHYMSKVLDALADPDTVVIMDTTPLLVSSEADAVATHADHILIIVEAGGTSVDELETMLQMLGKYEASVSFVMNKLSTHGRQGAADQYKYSY